MVKFLGIGGRNRKNNTARELSVDDNGILDVKQGNTEELIEALTGNNYYYDNGAEKTVFEKDTMSPADDTTKANVTKQSDHLLLFASSVDSGAEASFITSEKIDLTNVRALMVDWEQTGENFVQNTSRISILNDKNVAWHIKVKELVLTNTFGRQISKLDVSNLKGEYFVRFLARDGSAAAAVTSNLKIYGLWADSGSVGFNKPQQMALDENKKAVNLSAITSPAGEKVLLTTEIAPAGYEEATDSTRVKVVNSVEADVLNFPNRKREVVTILSNLQVRSTETVTHELDISKYESYTLFAFNSHDQPIRISYRRTNGALLMVWDVDAWKRADVEPFRSAIPTGSLWHDLGSHPYHGKILNGSYKSIQLRLSAETLPTSGNLTIELHGILRG